MTERQIPLDAAARADEVQDDGTHEVTDDIAYRRVGFVNAVLFGAAGAGDRQWVLVDAGLPGSANAIARAAAERFGEGARPAAIVLTHGHFDHVGALEELAERWDVPVYAHELELPFLTGRASYPPADAPVGGVLAPRPPLLPGAPVDVSRRLHALPDDGSIPGMPGFRWLHTPGHTPGHVSFWRVRDRTLVVGDAFVTTNVESAYAAVTARPAMHGPPPSLTAEWTDARKSVERLSILEPERVITGHGHVMRGSSMRAALHVLAREFDRVAVPGKGRWVREPGREEGPGAERKD